MYIRCCPAVSPSPGADHVTAWPIRGRGSPSLYFFMSLSFRLTFGPWGLWCVFVWCGFLCCRSVISHSSVHPAEGEPASVHPSVQCPFYVVLLVPWSWEQCNVKRALAGFFSPRPFPHTHSSSSHTLLILLLLNAGDVYRSSDIIALLYHTESSAIVLSKHLWAAKNTSACVCVCVCSWFLRPYQYCLCCALWSE